MAESGSLEMEVRVRFRPRSDLYRLEYYHPGGSAAVSTGPWLGVIGQSLGFPRRALFSEHAPRGSRYLPGRDLALRRDTDG